MSNFPPQAQAADRDDDLFGDPISVYTDAAGIEDGFLVDVSRFTRVRFLGLPVNRMTRHLFDDLEPFVEGEAPAHDGSFGRSLASILATKCRFAKGSPDNTGEVGDIYRIPSNLWLVRNEVDGWTAMYPSDY